MDMGGFLCFSSTGSDIFKNPEKIKKTAEEVTKAVKEGACFIAGTLVLTSLGLVPIETVAAGDMVQSFDPQTQQASFKEVEETFVRETMEFVHVTV